MNYKKIISMTTLPLISLPVALVSSCANTQQIQKDKLIKIVNQFLGSKIDVLNQKPSQIELQKLLKDLKPSQTFGFALTPSIDNKNDKLGQLDLTIKFTRGSEEFDNKYSFSNLKTEEQELNDKDIKPEDFLNFIPNQDNSFIRMNASDDTKTQSITTLVRELNEADDKENKLKEIITNINPINSKEDNTQPSLLKQKLTDGLSLRFNEFKAIELFGIPNGIRTKVQIVKINNEEKVEKISSAFVLDIVGFTSPIEKFRTTNFLNSYIDNFFDSIASPVNIEFEKEYLDKLASEMQTKDQLSALLSSVGSKTQLNGAEVTFELIKLIDNSQDDKTGSLKAEFKFQLKGTIPVPDPVPPLEIGKPINKVVTLFGFKIKN